ncbi:putative qde-2-interacting protein [Rosellinia necatrix]|uniref:Putative qde-2-interacting protein n=1 Tax=Rosellinia necatrix TaxID=77044 RepID=A0A1W2THX1_ROSNE|nr:putative qde-2-interacting protein [Rosellinia necatrix]
MASNIDECWDAENSNGEVNTLKISGAVVSTQPPSPLQVKAQETRAVITVTASRPTFPLISDAFQPLGLAFGETSEIVSTFAPFRLVQEYPHTYVGKSNRKHMVEFFDRTLLNGRVWDFFCQCHPTGTKDPLLLVPTIQFEQYLNIATHQLSGVFTIPRGTAGGKFTLSFGEWDAPRPRFLGRTNSTCSIDVLKEHARTLPADNLGHLTPACYQMYHDKMEKIYRSLEPTRSKEKSAAAMSRRIQKRKDSGRMIKRLQRYLGLRQSTSHASFQSSTVTNWDTSKPAPFKARESVRLVCVDVEAYEKDNRAVTEVGLAILDTDDIVDTYPGERGENWYSLVQAYHFRIKERSYMVNSQYVQGCPEAFNFGKSEMVSLETINKIVGKVIHDEESRDQRPIIIVGHDIGQDLNYLKKIGYNPWGVKQIVDEIDTKAMFQRVERSMNGRGLAMMCAELGIFGRNYHNAGNDAVYTLQAAIALAIKRTIEGSDRKEDSSTPGTDEWTDGDMDDGGCPKRSAQPAEIRYEAQNIRW